MTRFCLFKPLISVTLLLATPLLEAQSIDDLNLQIHGFVTQAFIKTNHNSWDTTGSEDGSASWSEAVLNLSLQPQARLKVGVQTRFYRLGDYGGTVGLDWAQVDYTASSMFGFRVGKVKTPSGLLNETQDIDPAHLWVLLPQSVYPIASRNFSLSHFGGVAYGAIPLGESRGKLEYRAFAGQRVLAADDGYFQPLTDQGLTLPHGASVPIYGETLRWLTPLRGLMAGASLLSQGGGGEIDSGPNRGTITSPRSHVPYFFGKYERGKLMAAGEYSRLAPHVVIQFPGFPAIYAPRDQRSFYIMASYKPSNKLTGGLYYSSSNNHQSTFTSARYQKDWALAARYDFNSFIYAKAEQHFIDGTEIGFAGSDNPNLQPTTRMTMFKLGVSF